MKESEIDWSGCSCHISPPCSYCVSHSECSLCEDFFLIDDMTEFEDSLICEDCAIKAKSKRGAQN